MADPRSPRSTTWSADAPRRRSTRPSRCAPSRDLLRALPAPAGRARRAHRPRRRCASTRRSPCWPQVRVARSRSGTATGHRGSRSSVGDGRDTLAAWSSSAPSANWRERELRPGRRGLFSGKVGEFNGTRQLVHPEYQLLARRGRRRSGRAIFAGALIPVYPATKDVRTWTIASARSSRCSPVLDPCRTRSPADAPGPARPAVDFDTALRGDAQAGRPRSSGTPRGAGWSGTRRSACSSRWPSAGGGRGATRPRRAPPRDGGLLDAFDARLPFALTDGQRDGRRRDRRRAGRRSTRCTGCCRARSARARPSSRCGRCCRSSTPAGRPRCSRRPRCSPRSTPARSRRCSARWRRPASSAAPTPRPASRCSPARCRPPRAGRRCSTRRAARPGIVVGTHALLQEQVSSPTSAWSSSTSSTGSASSSATRCAARRRRRRTCWS